MNIPINRPLNYLRARDFKIVSNSGQSQLQIVLKNPTLVFFYSNTCSFCDDFLKEYKQLPKHVTGCNITLTNTSLDQQMVRKMAHNTTTPINYVPFFVLFNKGMPIVEYTGQRSIHHIASFIGEVQEKLTGKAPTLKNVNRVQGGKMNKREENQIPAFSIGIPRGEADVCYMKFDKAYASGENCPDGICTYKTMDDAYNK
jgi:hypothetical protein